MRTSSANGNQGSKWIRPEKRRAIYRRDRYLCAYCRCPVHIDTFDGLGSLATLDHINGRHKDNRVNNLVTCCHRCNSRKKDLSVDVFLAKLAEEGYYPPVWEV